MDVSRQCKGTERILYLETNPMLFNLVPFRLSGLPSLSAVSCPNACIASTRRTREK